MVQPLSDFSVPVFTKALTNLKAQLVKAQAFCVEKKVNESVLLQSRLAIDMLPFVKQVQIASDNAKGTTARLIGVEPPKMEDTEQNLAELIVRIDKTLAFLSTIKPGQFTTAAQTPIRLPYFPEKHFLGGEFLPEYGLPNFFFHTVTAYAILRHVGVNLGKADYMGALSMYAD
ncbi:MAG: DUF1993 domain-containing protein [Candidatus Moranbacteria bacterium]|jgi:hypothetical protein|nr:DUF1993 domain-containing protein [Candidatus Moranbacteria bacterium]MBP9801953.1 DUF1993 domain-containing protein [Candidatus Moranbacteria bacterium]